MYLTPADVIERLLAQRGWSSAQLAEELTALGWCCSKRAVNYWRRGERVPSQKLVEALRQALDEGERAA